MKANLQLARSHREKSKLARCASRAAWLFTAGELVGLAAVEIAASYSPGVRVSATVITHAAGAAFSLIGLLTALFSKRKPLAVYHNRTTQDLAGCIADAEMMFVQGMINDRQRAKIISWTNIIRSEEHTSEL